MATGASTEGPKPPDVTSPTGVPSSAKTCVPSRIGAPASGGGPPRARRGPPAHPAPAPPPCAARFSGLLDRPDQPCLDRRGGCVDVMAVKAKPRLQPQAVPRAKADGRHLGLIQQRTGQSPRLRVRHRDFKPVLAGIARARDPQIDPAPRI